MSGSDSETGSRTFGRGTQAKEDRATVSVPLRAPADAVAVPFHDKQFGVGFEVPAGWEFAQEDHQLSSFQLDAPAAGANAEVRGVAEMTFNPFPLSTLSGALFYFSVERHTKKTACAAEAEGRNANAATDQEAFSGALWTHGHDESGKICVEARDEIYTTYRRGSCYRLDLEMNTFCAISSGALEITDRQVDVIEDKMNEILGSVVLDWGKKSLKTPAEPKKLPPPVAEGGGVGART